MSECRLFADNTNLTHMQYADNVYNHVFYAMNSDLNTLKSWLDANKLVSLNALKTKCMFISTRHRLATTPDIKRVNQKTHKSLGIDWMSSYLVMNI
jgi:hypothetical protein